MSGRPEGQDIRRCGETGGVRYCMTFLEERRHPLDMVQPFNIVRGHDAVANDHWLSIAQ